MAVSGTMASVAGCVDDVEEDDVQETDDVDEADDTEEAVDEADDVDEVADDDADETDDDVEAEEPEYGTFETYEFSGQGDTVESGVFVTNLVEVRAEHDGQSNFIVHLVDDDRSHLFVNEIGQYDGTVAEIMDADEYLLDVEADGNWSVEIAELWADRGYDLPISESGTGPTLLGPYEFTGSHVATSSHDGESNFIVRVMPEFGFPTLLANEIGQYDGQTTFNVDEPAWIAIEADGSWSIEIE